MNSEDKKRCFIACPVNDDILAFLKKHRQLISGFQWSKAIRWTTENNIHLTLRFLGDITSKQIAAINAGLDYRFTEITEFPITILQPTAFPNLRRPSVIASPVRPSSSLSTLVNIIEDVVSSQGITAEKRPYRGHISIAWVKSAINGRDLISSAPEEISMPVEQVVFYQSELRHEGPVYTALKTFKLLSGG